MTIEDIEWLTCEHANLMQCHFFKSAQTTTWLWNSSVCRLTSYFSRSLSRAVWIFFVSRQLSPQLNPHGLFHLFFRTLQAELDPLTPSDSEIFTIWILLKTSVKESSQFITEKLVLIFTLCILDEKSYWCKNEKKKYIDEQTNKQTKKQTRSILNHLEGPNMVPFFLTSSIIFLFSLLWLTLRFRRKNWIIETKYDDHEGTRTPNLPIRSRTPYPLGHAANRRVFVQI